MNINQRHPLVEAAYQAWLQTPTPRKRDWASQIKAVATDDINSTEVDRWASCLRILCDRETKKQEAKADSVADKSIAARVWVKRKKGTYLAELPPGEFSLSETIRSLESEFNDEGKTVVDQVRQILDDYQPTYHVPVVIPTETSEKMLRVIISDTHVALNPNPDNTSLFAYEYNEVIFAQQIDQVIAQALLQAKAFGPFDLFVIECLGDSLDGFNGFTTRGGHKLPQNMGNDMAMQTYVEGMLKLIESMVSHGVARRYVINSIENDNHSGSFAGIAAWTIQTILYRVYGNERIQLRRMRRFMEHYFYGEHAFVLTHGKDKEFMKRGLPLILTPFAIRFIENYIAKYEITSKRIHIDKGDLHTLGYAKTDHFDYTNYMTFAPPSSYGTHNFVDAYAGYTIQVVPRVGPITSTHHQFELAMTPQLECAPWVL